MSSARWVTGQWILDQGVQPFELIQAVNTRDLPAYDHLTGDRVNEPPTPEEEARLRELFDAWNASRFDDNLQRVESLKGMLPFTPGNHSAEMEQRLNEVKNYAIKRDDAERVFPALKTSPPQKMGKKQKRGKITQKDAAALCGVSLRTFQKWDSGEETPPEQGFPGRKNLLAFQTWAATLQRQRKIEEAARAASRPTQANPQQLDEVEYRSALEDD